MNLSKSTVRSIFFKMPIDISTRKNDVRQPVLLKVMSLPSFTI